MGTGTGAFTFSGTSMSAPHVSGVAALALQAHPGWQADEVSTAIVNTASAARSPAGRRAFPAPGWSNRVPATRTSVIARGTADLPSLSFGVQEFSRAFQAEQEIVVRNLGTRSARFSVSVTPSGGTSPHSVQVNPTVVSVLAGQSTRVRVKLKVPVGHGRRFERLQGCRRPHRADAGEPERRTAARRSACRTTWWRAPAQKSKRNIVGNFGPAHPRRPSRGSRTSRRRCLERPISTRGD